MCQSMVDIQSPTAEIRRGKKEEEEEEEERKKQDENIMVCPITQGDHNHQSEVVYELSIRTKIGDLDSLNDLERRNCRYFTLFQRIPGRTA